MLVKREHKRDSRIYWVIHTLGQSGAIGGRAPRQSGGNRGTRTGNRGTRTDIGIMGKCGRSDGSFLI